MRTLKEVRKVIEYRGGFVFKTSRVCMIWKHYRDERTDNEIAKEFTGKSPFDKEEISQDETDYYLQQGLGGAEIEELRRRGR